MKTLITDVEYSDIDLERTVLEAAGFEVELAQCRSPEDVINAAQGATALLVQYASITAEVLQALPELRIISRYGVGVDSVDVEAARECGVWVANVTDYSIEEVPSHALGMIFALVRHLPFYDREVKEGKWHYLSTGPLHRTKNLVLGVVGLGHIGRTLAERGGLWFKETVGYDPYLPQHAWPEGIARVESLQDLFSQSNVISLHLPLSTETQGLIDRSLLELLPEGSYLVNTARGELVVLEDVLWALSAEHLAGAGLDVLSEEPPPKDHTLLEHPQILLSPHAGWYSMEAEEELRRKAALNVVYWAQEGEPLYTVVEGSRG